MYVCGFATLQLKGGRVARKGDPVPEAASWSESIRRSFLRCGALIEIHDLKNAAPVVKPSPAPAPKVLEPAKEISPATAEPVIAELEPQPESLGQTPEAESSELDSSTNQGLGKKKKRR